MYGVVLDVSFLNFNFEHWTNAVRMKEKKFLNRESFLSPFYAEPKPAHIEISSIK